ncbi:MAG TPA: hypothetical protein V6C86_27130 [Oculatellaceae cyanobacterium]
METCRQLVYECCTRITLPVILCSPVLFFFTVFCILDENFLSSDIQVVVLLWVLVGLSLVYFLAMRKEREPGPNVMFGIGSVQLGVLVAACCSMFAVVQEDSNTPKTQLTENGAALRDMIMNGIR